jgi:hypothetical protein
MIKKSAFLLIPAMVIALCGWIPFTAPVTIHTTPEGAEVYELGQEAPLGVTPYTTRVLATDKVLELRLPGYAPKTFTIESLERAEVYFELQPQAVTVDSVPPATLIDPATMEVFAETPVEVDITEGPRTFILKVAGFFDKEITVDATTPTPLSVELEALPEITLITDPAGASVYEDGNRLGSTPMIKQIGSERTFEVRKEGYYPQTVTLSPESALETSVTLEALPVVTVETKPAAVIYVVGNPEPIGTAPVSLTVEQDTQLEARLNRYYSESFTVKPKTQTVTVDLTPMPYVTVSSQPTGAEVVQDGVSLGTAPVELLVEKATKLTIRKDGFIEKSVSLTGTEKTVRVELSPIPAEEVVLEEVIVIEEPVELESVQEAVVETEEPEEGDSSFPMAALITVIVGGIIGAIIAVATKGKKIEEDEE